MCKSVQRVHIKLHAYTTDLNENILSRHYVSHFRFRLSIDVTFEPVTSSPHIFQFDEQLIL